MQMSIKKLVLIFLLCSVVQAAQVIRYVDTDVVGGAADGTSWANAYSTLSAWDTGEATDLVNDGDYHTVYCRASSGTTDTTQCTLAYETWTTDATHYVEIIGDDFPSDGIYDDTKYVLHNNDSADAALIIDCDYVKVRKLQILVTGAGSTMRNGIYWRYVHSNCYLEVDSCIIKGVCSGTGWGYGLYLYTTTSYGVADIYNTLVYGFSSASDTDDYIGIRVRAVTTTDLYNCTFYGNYHGMSRDAGTVTATNCAVGDSADDFAGTITVDYCCSDDGTGTNAQNPSGADWDNEFTDDDNEDFSLLVGGNCVGNGTDNPGAGLYSDDMIDTARSSTWDISAREYTAGAPASAGQVIMVEMF